MAMDPLCEGLKALPHSSQNSGQSALSEWVVLSRLVSASRVLAFCEYQNRGQIALSRGGSTAHFLQERR